VQLPPEFVSRLQRWTETENERKKERKNERMGMEPWKRDNTHEADGRVDGTDSRAADIRTDSEGAGL